MIIRLTPVTAGVQPKPFKLSLCGATALTHDAVSALLRLPMLSDLKIDGCYRITSMDKMRLVAKVKAGASFGAPSQHQSASRTCGAPPKYASYSGRLSTPPARRSIAHRSVPSIVWAAGSK